MAMGAEILIKQMLKNIGIEPSMLEELANGFGTTFQTLLKGQANTNARLKRLENMIETLLEKQGLELPPEPEQESVGQLIEQ